MNNGNSGKTVLVILVFILFIMLFASGSIGSTDLTPDTPPAQEQAFAPAFDGSVDPNAGLAAGGPLLPEGQAAGACGPVYTVQPGDTLFRIASYCGVTIEAILAANPEITDPAQIQAGQQIRLVPGAQPAFDPALLADPGDSKNPNDVFLTPSAAPYSEPAPEVLLTPLPEDPYSGEPQPYPPAGDSGGEPQPYPPADDSYGPDPSTDGVPTAFWSTPPAPAPVDALLPDGLVPGGVIHVTVRGLPPTTPLTIGIGKQGDVPTPLENRITDENGELILHLAIPARARPGELWEVTVLTRRNPPATVKSVPFTIQ